MELGSDSVLFLAIGCSVSSGLLLVACFFLVCNTLGHESFYTPDATFTPSDDLPTVIYYRKPDSAFIDKEHFLKAVTKLEEANSNSSSDVSSSSNSSTGLIGESV